MRVVIVSSPGGGSSPHWSHGQAAALADVLVRRGAVVRWLAGLGAREPAPTPADAVAPSLLRHRRPRAVAAVPSRHRDPWVERALSGCLRELPGAAVVHLGVGAPGSPNVLWLAERLGSPGHAVLRGAELVCLRGDLVDRDGRSCHVHDDVTRCVRCVRSWWHRPRADDMRNRADLLFASLGVAVSVSVPTAPDRVLVEAFGVATSKVSVGVAPEAVADRVLTSVRTA